MIQEALKGKLQQGLSEEYRDRMKRFQHTINMLYERTARDLFASSTHLYLEYYRSVLRHFEGICEVKLFTEGN